MSEYLCCPECKGRCCEGTTFGDRVPHTPQEKGYAHVCINCPDGFIFAPRSAEEERADVIAYLAHAATFPNPILPMNRYIETLRENIERGEHSGWSKKP
jgi:hypothetical protein